MLALVSPRHARGGGLVARGELRLDPYISHGLPGLERVPEAFAITADKARHGALGPCQVLIDTDGGIA